ncbi:MAG: response regulator [Saprospiraceae bacterium]|jgi:DNA-binding LytR/AlgR family response regulator|nr:response regulator [Saprospiraceae bacterium]HRD82899.1 response regulator [Saprospiraceae bacterium]
MFIPYIYIVEDDPIIGADLADRLQEMGHQAAGPFADGESAYEHLSVRAPDLIIMDIQLEGAWDGIETARRIMAKCAAPIIFLTSNSDDATFKEAKATLPAAFLSKPFRGRDLKYSIELALSNRAKETASEAPSAQPEEQAYILEDRLFVKIKDRWVRILLQDIQWAEADDYACKVAVGDKEMFVGQTLGKFGEALAAKPEFMRVHRSFIVNLKYVDQIGDMYLYIGRKQIPLSKTLKDELFNRIQKI